MKKVREFELVKLEMSGFKGMNESQKVVHLFGKVLTRVEGDNYTGKTTIQDAVCYTLFGCNRYGDSKENKTLINLSSSRTKLDLTIRFDGSLHLISKRYGKSGSLKFDEATVTQEFISELVDKEEFLCQFHPEYFLQLEPEKQREILVTKLPPIPEETVISQLTEKSKELLKGTNIGDCTFQIKNLRKEKSELEEKKFKTLGKLEGLDMNISIPEEKTFDDAEIKTLQAQTNKLSIGKVDTSAYQSQVEILKKQLTDLPQLYAPKTTKELEATKDALLQTYNAKKAMLKNVAYKEGNTCPECLQELSKDHIESLIEKAKINNAPILKDLNEIKGKGVKLAAEIETVKKDNISTAKKLIEEQNRINQEIHQLEQKLRPEKNSQLDKQIEVLNNKIQEIQRNKDGVIEANTRRKSLIEQLDRNKNLHTAYTKEIETIGCRIISIDNKIYALKEYIIKRSQILSQSIHSSLKKVSIQLEKIIEDTGEVKSCFEILYDTEKKYVKCLSTSERMRAGMEIGDLIKKYSETNYPLFVDCAESITHYETSANQIIEAYVVKGKPLTVTPVNEQSPKSIPLPDKALNLFSNESAIA